MTLNALTMFSLLAITRFTAARPVSPSHRFTMYNPYWTQESRSSLALPDCVFNLCKDRLSSPPLPLISGSDYDSELPSFRATKRSKNVYKSGWTMGGMPFSVLYMNPKAQTSVHSPITESLRSLPPAYDNSQSLVKESPPIATDERANEFPPEVQAQALTSRLEEFPAPTIIPTRRQYSIIPQLFVSYGWGPLGKKRNSIDFV